MATDWEDEERSPQGPSRRAILAAAGLTALGGGIAFWARQGTERPIRGGIVGGTRSLGHRLRDPGFLAGEPASAETMDVVIVGGGIAGLSAAWWLDRNGIGDFRVLELEEAAGGNSRWGKNSVSAYPWAAHYVPLPGPDARYVHELFRELGVVTGHDAAGRPIYEETFLCADPHERLLQEGRWHEGLVPRSRPGSVDRAHFDAFAAAVERWKGKTARDGRPPFTIPIDGSSADPELRALDRVSFADWLASRGWTSSLLRAHVDYCCRDDFGLGAGGVSAWAGLHYFASRVGTAANAEAQTVLTWPEGNGWLAERLREKAGARLRTRALAYDVSAAEDGVVVDYYDAASDARRRLRAKHAVVALPRFVAAHVVEDLRSSRPSYLSSLTYVPWMVANVTVSALPQGRGAALAWDNVRLGAKALGYVVATHQSLASRPRKTVLTFYLPLDEEPPVEARRRAEKTPHEAWARTVVDELEKMHPGIARTVENIDVYLWGHGMIAPTPGFIWGEARRAMLASVGNVHFAHTDMSGISIFEEAQYRGVEAARAVLRGFGKKA